MTKAVYVGLSKILLPYKAVVQVIATFRNGLILIEYAGAQFVVSADDLHYE